MKVILTIPESYKDITVLQYQKFWKLTKDNEASHFVNQKTIEIFCNCKNANLLPLGVVTDALKQIDAVFQTMPKLVQRFTLNGVEFGFIPNLDNISFGEYVDINSYIDNVEDFHKALAVLYRPIKTKAKNLYDIEEYKGSDMWAEQMKYAPLDAILGAKVFFCSLASELLQITTNSLATLPAETMEIIRQKVNLASVGDGINLFTNLQKEMLGTLVR